MSTISTTNEVTNINDVTNDLPPTPEVLQTPDVTGTDDDDNVVDITGLFGECSSSSSSEDDYSWITSPTLSEMEKSIEHITQFQTPTQLPCDNGDNDNTPIQWCFHTPVHHSSTPPQLTTMYNDINSRKRKLDFDTDIFDIPSNTTPYYFKRFKHLQWVDEFDRLTDK